MREINLKDLQEKGCQQNSEVGWGPSLSVETIVMWEGFNVSKSHRRSSELFRKLLGSTLALSQIK